MADSKSRPAVDDYEVKFFLAAGTALNDEDKPADAVRKAFDLDRPPERLAMQFLDDRDANLHRAEKWNVRFRRSDDEDDAGVVELTYKKRYGGEAAIDDALHRAAQDGFSRGDGFDCQVEWGLEKRTLTLSRKLKRAADELGLTGDDIPLALPDLPRSLAWALEGPPDQLSPAARQGLADASKLYGPVRGKRHRGLWKDQKVALEVWHLRTKSGNAEEAIVELSFKQDETPANGGMAERLRSFLAEKEWLLDRDILKTSLILERY